MAISSFGRGKRGDETTELADVKSGGGNLTAFIDQGSDFDGKLTFKDTVRIDGSFQGEISSENTLIVGETGVIEAKIHSNTVIVSGTVVGDITAARQIVQVVGYVATGIFDLERLVLTLVAAVPVLIGFSLGAVAASRMNETVFRYAAMTMIVAASVVVLAREAIAF